MQKPTTLELKTELQASFIEEELTCCLCGTELEFEYEVEKAEQRLTERGQCPSCEIPAKTRKHAVH